MYRFDPLFPTSSEDAARHNAPLLGAHTLGIEVTEPALAAHCGLGNIDPQHDGSAALADLSAIEAALVWPLPPAGARLVTIRPDLDALGAMAVFAIRAEGRPITPPMRARIAEVGRVDRFAHGKWPGPRPMPESADDLFADVGGRDTSVLTAAVRDRARPFAELSRDMENCPLGDTRNCPLFG